jgi:hypothetical protein
MYAYGSIELTRPQVRAIPSSAVTQIGNRTCCYLFAADKAVRTEIQTGVSDGNWIEVQKRATFPIKGPSGVWQKFDGNEQVIVGDLSELSDGQKVAVSDDDRLQGTKLTSASAVHRETRKVALP